MKRNSTKVFISSGSKPIYDCLDCGRELTKYEYNKCSNICASCRSKGFDRGLDYIDLYGNNKIDDILIKKRERN